MRSRADLRPGLALLLLLAGCAGGRHRLVPDQPVRIGRPYQAGGRWYVPADDPAYDQTGLASWYGPGQGRTTANGERFDARRIGAAHRTLPLPSYAEVTALATGRRILVRINDRGPFRPDRLIDLSFGAAQLLGITRSGVARVRVRRAYPDEATRRLLRSGYPARPLPGVAPADRGIAALAQPGGGGYHGADTDPVQGTSTPR